ncbi:MAG: type III pantothenate kinase [Bacteroidota bacterium]
MGQAKRVLTIDAGNTAVKIATFVDGELIGVERVITSSFIDTPKKYLSGERDVIVLSSVLEPETTDELIKTMGTVFRIDHSTETGLNLRYDNPASLGIDRICNAAAIRQQARSTHAVSVDIGTCVKFDLVSGKDYLGGSISPGIDLRYRALNDYTANLPLQSERDLSQLNGQSTSASILSGVMNGMDCEIKGMMQRYAEEYSDLTFFVTGGDSAHFDFHGKNNIFADENLTLKGLYYIYLANVH